MAVKLSILDYFSFDKSKMKSQLIIFLYEGGIYVWDAYGAISIKVHIAIVHEDKKPSRENLTTFAYSKLSLLNSRS